MDSDFITTPATVESALTPPLTPSAIDDDIWGDDSSHPSSPSSFPPTTSPSADLQKLRQTHITLGYRDGITASKSHYLQPGFDEGYQLGGRIGIHVGWIHGVIDALSHIFPSDAEVLRAVRDAYCELAVETVYGKEWWDEGGVWKWEVEGDAVSFDKVVDAFPLLKKWSERVQALAVERGLDLKDPDGEVDEVAGKSTKTTL
ncbi:hypothetical protein BDD12DRAFT_803099 [Trichophaea hybrida]|nr:hypothetical protein BDD12DRAFT_803099 [Trichophaea hybrida]